MKGEGLTSWWEERTDRASEAGSSVPIQPFVPRQVAEHERLLSTSYVLSDPSTEVTIIIPIYRWTRKQRLREVQQLAQSHTALWQTGQVLMLCNLGTRSKAQVSHLSSGDKTTLGRWQSVSDLKDTVAPALHRTPCSAHGRCVSDGHPVLACFCSLGLQ